MKALLLLAALVSAAQADTIDAPVVMHAEAPNGSAVHLHDVAGPCVAGAKLATWIGPGGSKKVQGCFRVSEAGIVQVAWFDTDIGAMPARAFRRFDES